MKLDEFSYNGTHWEKNVWAERLHKTLKKLIDDLEMKYCVQPKCQGLFDCKLCFECPLSEHISNYRTLMSCVKR